MKKEENIATVAVTTKEETMHDNSQRKDSNMKSDTAEANGEDGYVHSGSSPTLPNTPTDANGKDGFVHSGTSPTILNILKTEPTVTQSLCKSNCSELEFRAIQETLIDYVDMAKKILNKVIFDKIKTELSITLLIMTAIASSALIRVTYVWVDQKMRIVAPEPKPSPKPIPKPPRRKRNHNR